MKTFLLGDSLNPQEMKRFKLESGQGVYLANLDYAPRNVKAVFTGEKRCPKKGEWYLGGAIVTAYRAPNDLSTVFHIARLVKVETKTVETIVEG